MPAERAFLQHVLHHARVLRVEADHRLVNHEHLRIVQQRGDDGDALPRAVRQAFERAVGEFFEVKARDQFVRVFFDARGVEPEHLAGETEKFPRRQLVVKKRKIRNVSQPPARFQRLRLHVETADPRVAGRGFDQAGEKFHHRRLAGGVGAEQGEKLAALDLERHVVDGHEVAEFFDKLDRVQSWLAPLVNPRGDVAGQVNAQNLTERAHVHGDRSGRARWIPSR